MTPDQILARAIAAYKAGRKTEARQLLEQILQQDEANEAAWLWLSGAVETDAQRLACLEQVLAINPDNEVAQRGLAHLRAARGAGAQPAPPTPSSSALAQPTSSPGTVAQPMPSISAAQRPAPSSARAQSPPSSRSTPRPEVSLSAPPPAPSNGAGVMGSQSTLDRLLKMAAGLAVGIVAAVFGYVFISSALKSLPDDFSLFSKATPTPAEWQTFTSQNGHFAVLMPGTPKSEVDSVKTLIGTVDLHSFMVETDDFAYFVAYGDFPPAFVQSADTDAMLDGARDGAVADVNGSLVSERRISVQGFPGRELWIEATVSNQKGLAQARMILVGNRFYQVLVVGPKERFAESQAERFLNTFQVLR
jgi:hypothetical protein